MTLREEIRKLILDNHVAIQVNDGVACRVAPPEVIDSILSLISKRVEGMKKICLYPKHERYPKCPSCSALDDVLQELRKL